jgi:N-acetylglucosaminyldiphosphoundecaprenol N-acetyl-beta-D-mannosaminyltransferase
MDLRSNLLLGVPIGPASLNEIIDDSLQAVDSTLKQRIPYVFACANPHSLAVAEHDAEFKAALLEAQAVVADGVGVTLMAKLCGRDIGPRITGSDYFVALMSALNARRRARVLFFGSHEHVLLQLAERVRTDFPRIEIVGLFSPAFGEWSPEQNEAYLDAINIQRPDVLWVGMTAPRQEKWIAANRQRLNAGVAGAIGAVFDYYAGTVQRAPQWMCAAGLEWAFRMAREPRRMWRRNFVSAPVFFWRVLVDALRARRTAAVHHN